MTCDTGPTSTKSSMSDNMSPVSKAFSTRDSVFLSPRSHLSPAIRVHGSVSRCYTHVHVTLSCMNTLTMFHVCMQRIHQLQTVLHSPSSVWLSRVDWTFLPSTCLGRPLPMTTTMSLLLQVHAHSVLIGLVITFYLVTVKESNRLPWQLSW